MVGRQSLKFDNTVFVEERACIAGKKEGEGPLKELIDFIEEDPMFGMNTWEEAESQLQKRTIELLLRKAGIKEVSQSGIRYIFAGDLLGQLIATSFGIQDFNLPVFGLYGACSTMGESIGLASMAVNAGYANRCISLASSHFASAEKQFRYPLEYGNQRPLAATWTVTGCGSVIIGNKKTNIAVSGITTGKITDYGVKDSMNMGACMAPAACDVIAANFEDFKIEPSYYDKIITGDLGYVGRTILYELLKERGYDITGNYTDCGIEIFDKNTQDTHAGGSGCGCSAVTLCSYILKNIAEGKWQRVLFVPTGALHSTVSYNEGKSIPSIAHAVMFEKV